MNQATRTLRVAVADDERDVRQYFQEMLPALGHEVAVVASTGRELVDLCRSAKPDLVVTDVRMPDMDGIEAAAEVNRAGPIPVILVTGHPEPEALARAGADYVMAFLSKPAKPVDLQAAISLAMLRFGHFQALKQEAADLRQALDDRKLIERAKGVLMRRFGVDEEEAFRRLRSGASRSNQKLAEASRRLLEAEAVIAEHA
ncbi:MAG: response regulator [Gemmataceae bacterium]|nr:response regulator [Gemmataceae bacterium]